MSEQNFYPVIIIGAGAAGLMCAISAAERGRKVLVVDHNKSPGKKILVSGGGRCNFTNLYIESENYLSNNPYFCKSALSRYSQYDFMAMLDKNFIPYQEKKLGQLFCTGKSSEILQLLLSQCEQAGVEIKTECSIKQVIKEDKFYLQSSKGPLSAESLVVATGGLSIPKMGASDYGLQLAKQFNLNIIKPQAALVPLCLETRILNHTKTLAGISVDSLVSCNQQSFRENILFTHKGLSGPAILQISNYWQPGDSITINLLPDMDLYQQILDWQISRPKAELKTLLNELLSKRLVLLWLELYATNKPIKQCTTKEIESIVKSLQQWTIIPSGSEGYRIAEVTRGGVDCDEFSSKTFESKKVSQLFFIGEVLDVTGWLGGYNFQWAWSSGFCAGAYV
ncbi:MAG: NAD(P)/FAD-dependent oxidoreductase [Pseudomonadota bacterium]